MDAAYEFKYHQLEEKNWWFVSRRDIILQLIKKSRISKNAKILEIGCSGGPLISYLNKNGFNNLTGIDISKSAIETCKKRGIKNVKVMDGAQTNFSENHFDLIIASDILEHIKDEKSAVSEWRRIMKPEGKLIMFVPAFNFLWSSHDEANHHCRRYSKTYLRNLLTQANLKIDASSYWNFSLLIPAFLLQAIRRATDIGGGKKDQLYGVGPIINGLLTRLLKTENLILKFLKFPFGVSVFAVCRK